MTDESLGTLITGGLGAGLTGLAWLARWWFTQKREQRADAVASANAHAQKDMLADAMSRAKEAEAEADEERKGRKQDQDAFRIRLEAEQRDRLISEGAHKDAERDLRAARRDIARLRKRMRRDGVPDSEIADLIETRLGDLDDNPPTPAKS